MLNISAARRAQKKSLELNIAPLIDMVFILLIFFLVTTSFVKETGVDINRPSANTAVSNTKASILIGLTRDNRVYMEKREIDTRAVRANVERALAENPESAVVIVADKESMTGHVISLMDECKMAGAENVSIAASHPEK
ncbi:biopolymer transporter ExbD [Candidatus Magnetomorum sp. HK-1]|nr:biopolymer transporter ExbD [Candidatus Magnetomorum sp. HK-1]